MALVRPPSSKSAAGTMVVRGARQSWVMKSVATVGVLALLGLPSSASALTISGGPVYSLPGGGSCSISGIATNTGGATVSCTGVNLGAHTKVYFGVKNDTNVTGNTMTGSAPGAGSAAVFRYLTNTGSSVTYSSTTTVPDALNGTQAVNNRLILTLLSGSASMAATSGIPANNTRGDIERLFQITSGSSFTVRVDVQANDPIFPSFGYANPNVFDPTNTPSPGGGEISKVDLGFYFSDCGDGVADSPEQCDLGGSNGTPSSCCTATCTYRPNGEVCRPGAGAPCDLSEMCTGLSSACPFDDAPLNGGNVVCRPGSGDDCDENEVCTGTPGQGCPADDAPGNAGMTCRVSTTGDICDEDEVCTGIAGQPCPLDDAPSKLNVVCRAGSGDICDPEERCAGNPGQPCPPDVVANPSTVCRTGSGDSCDPSEFCTAVPGQTCPPNVVTSAGTQCRAAAGVCDVAEQCTGNAGATCPANGFVAATTSCNVDANICTTDECNGSGSCVFVESLDCSDGNICTQDSCDPINGCEYSGTPATTCAPATKAVFKYKNSTTDLRDGIAFLWKGGPSLVEDMGDPTQTTRYELCVYDNLGVQLALGVAPGVGWEASGSPSSPKGYKYKDSNALQDGIKLIKTKASNLGNAKVKVVGKGDAMPDTATLPFQWPVTAQVYASDGMCWEAEFNTGQTKRNDDAGFIGKAP